MFEDSLDFKDAFVDSVPREWYVANWGAQEDKPARSRARNTSIKRVFVVVVGEVGATPDKGLGWIEVKTRCGALGLQDVNDALKILSTSDESSIIEVEDVEEQSRNFFFDAFGERKKSKGKKEGGKRITLLGSRCALDSLFPEE